MPRSYFCLQLVKVFFRVQSPTTLLSQQQASSNTTNTRRTDNTSTHSGTCFCLLAVHPPFRRKNPLSVRPICLQPPPAGARHQFRQKKSPRLNGEDLNIEASKKRGVGVSRSHRETYPVREKWTSPLAQRAYESFQFLASVRFRFELETRIDLP